MIDMRAHWEGVYGSKLPTEVSWYQEHLKASIEMIERSGTARNDHIIDAGGGASTLVDDLIERGFRNITVLDVSPKAIERSQARLGDRSAIVHWIAGDVLETPLEQGRYGLWHDRAVLHFLTDVGSRRKYVEQVRRAVGQGGRLVISAFSLDGPPKCSGLPVQRYSPVSLLAEFGPDFRMMESRTEDHRTPLGAVQSFIYCTLSFRGPA
jgi:SAM-dependent methyltransferase